MSTIFAALVVLSTPVLLAAVIRREIDHAKQNELRWRRLRYQQLQAREEVNHAS